MSRGVYKGRYKHMRAATQLPRIREVQWGNLTALQITLVSDYNYVNYLQSEGQGVLK